jgi:hypothetical protein
MVASQGEVLFTVDDLLEFDVGEIREEWFGEWQGAFRLRLRWQTSPGGQWQPEESPQEY